MWVASPDVDADVADVPSPDADLDSSHFGTGDDPVLPILSPESLFCIEGRTQRLRTCREDLHSKHAYNM